MKLHSRLSIVALLAVGALSLAACNDSGVVASPAQPSPSPSPTTPPGNEPPVADIESGSPIYSTMDTGTFDGSWSYDLDGYITSYQWELVQKPSGSTSTLQLSPDNMYATLFIDVAGQYSLKLTVTDDQGATGSTTYDFSAAPSALHVQLSWPNQYTQADMDLHLLEMSNGTGVPTQLWDESYDCHWRNCKPVFGEILDWGIPQFPADNPRLDIDNIEESVPENTNIDLPHDGTYRVAVHYYASHAGTGSDIPVDTHVNIWVNQVLVFSSGMQMTAADQVWNVADVMWTNSAGTVVPIGTITTTAGPAFFYGTTKPR